MSLLKWLEDHGLGTSYMQPYSISIGPTCDENGRFHILDGVRKPGRSENPRAQNIQYGEYYRRDQARKWRAERIEELSAIRTKCAVCNKQLTGVTVWYVGDVPTCFDHYHIYHGKDPAHFTEEEKYSISKLMNIHRLPDE